MLRSSCDAERKLLLLLLLRAMLMDANCFFKHLINCHDRTVEKDLFQGLCFFLFVPWFCLHSCINKSEIQRQPNFIKVNGTKKRRLGGSSRSPGEIKVNTQGNGACGAPWRPPDPVLAPQPHCRGSLFSGRLKNQRRAMQDAWVRRRRRRRRLGRPQRWARCLRGASAVLNQRDGLSTCDARCVVLWYDTREEY